MNSPPPSSDAGDLVFAGVTRRYGGHPVLDAVSFTAPAGGVTAILGASGSGKSTLLRLAAGLEQPDAGVITLGEDTLSGPHHFVAPEARRIAMVFQDYALFPHLTLAANVAFGIRDIPHAQHLEAARTWLARVGLEHRANAYPHQLSGGEQQRVSLVRALASQPRAVLLDEPFSGLDRDLRLSLRETTLQALRTARVTAVFVTHDAEDAMLSADQIVIVHAGSIIQAGPPRTVYDHPASLRAALALGPVNLWRTRAHANAAQTPLGAIACAFPNDTPVVVAIRPEALSLQSGGAFRIIDRRPSGGGDQVTISVGDQTWTANLPVDHPIGVGEATELSVASRGVFVFADGAH